MDSPYVISRENRKKAIEEGKNTFLSGTSCKHCGGREKYVSNRCCKTCCIKQLSDPSMDQYRSREQQQRWADNNKDKRRESYRKYYSTPKGKAKACQKASKRRAWKKDNTPTLTPEEKQRIDEIYRECGIITEQTGVPHQVDHIIPLSKGGKHHPDNLQILTAYDNQSKGDKLEWH
jgi:5-methylcytosine-specific restriction endonuclease McrA